MPSRPSSCTTPTAPPRPTPTYVGIVVRPGQMVDAPHTGTVVRTASFPSTVGAAWGEDRYLGATRPGAQAGGR
jgi:hypothetical protein